jgi:pimeloyl-ACP methyl ester carboxylesterase
MHPRFAACDVRLCRHRAPIDSTAVSKLLSVEQLPAAVNGECVIVNGAVGPMAVYVAGNGPPLLLIHSINASASAAEVAPLHEYFQKTRTVYSVDLPGYGRSDRSDRVYSIRLMTDALLVATKLIQQRFGKMPIDALAVSLSCEYLARAAVESPTTFRRIALVSPTGFNGLTPRRAAPGTSRQVRGMLGILRGPGWGGALFRGLTRPGVIRYFLERTWGSKNIDEALWRYDVLTTRVVGAEHAPLYFLSAALFSADIHTVYESLAIPVWMSHGDRGDFTDYRGKVLVEAKKNWHITPFAEAGALPYFEHPERFCAQFDQFLAR